MDFKFDDGEDSDEEVVKPKTQIVSPHLVDFTTQSLNNVRSYSPSDRKRITPSAISTPSRGSSISSRGIRNKAYNHNNFGGADGHTMDDIEQHNDEETWRRSSLQNLAVVDDSKKKDGTKQQLGRCCKYTLVLTVIIVGIAAVVVVIATNDDKKYPPTQQKQTGNTDECGIYILNSVVYRQPVNIEFNCTFSKEVSSSVTKMKIKFEPKYRYLNEHIEKEISVENEKRVAMTIHRWNISCDIKDKEIKCGFKREPVRCDNGGLFSVVVYNNAEELYKEEGEFDVEGEVSQVEMNLNETVDERSNSSIYDITCSTQSSCTPTSIWLFSKKDGVTERRFDINFTCIIQYNTQDGTTVDCTGSIPGSLLTSFGTILCRPHLNDSMEAEAKEAERRPPLCVGDECTFSCPDEDADIYYMDPLDCTLLHRCANRQLYSGPCPNSTYFNPTKCACDHKENVGGCDNTGMRVTKLKDTRCGDSTINN